MDGEAGAEAVDLLREAGIPDEVSLAVQAIEFGPEAKSIVARHPSGREIAAVVGLYRLDARTGRNKLTWDELAIGLNYDYPGLDATGPKLRAFCERTLDHALVVPAGWARKALLDATGELNTAKSLLDLREEALRAIDKMRDKVGEFEIVEGKGGKIHKVAAGPTLGEFTRALKDAGELTEKFAKEAARFGLLPEAKSDRPASVEVNVNIGGRMGRAMGSHPVDVPFTDKR